MFETPLGFKYVFVMAMMCQINYYAPRLHLPIEVPIKEQDIRFLHVSPPLISGQFQDYSGRIQVKNYSFTFGDKGHKIINIDEHGFASLGIPMGPKESGISGMERASRMKFIISTNDVKQMATNWLVAMDIDVANLEKVNPSRINNEPFHSDRGLVPSPLLTVNWKNPKRLGYDPTGVKVQISAVSGELLEINDGNGSFSNRKQPLIKDLKKLLAISDEVFLKYTEQERRELVERFAGEKCSITNVTAAIYDKLFMPKGTTSPNTLEKSDEKSHDAP